MGRQCIFLPVGTSTIPNLSPQSFANGVAANDMINDVNNAVSIISNIDLSSS